MATRTFSGGSDASISPLDKWDNEWDSSAQPDQEKVIQSHDLLQKANKEAHKVQKDVRALR